MTPTPSPSPTTTTTTTNVQDKVDDARVGVRSTALRFGARTKRWLTGFTVGTTSMLTAAGYLNQQGIPYYVAVAGCTAHLLWQVASVRLDDRQHCMDTFISNRHVGAMLTAGILADMVRIGWLQ